MNGYEILAGYSIGILVIYCVLLNAHYHSWYKTISKRNQRLLLAMVILWPIVAIDLIISSIMLMVFYPVVEPHMKQVLDVINNDEMPESDYEDEYLSDDEMVDWYENNKFPTQEKNLMV